MNPRRRRSGKRTLPLRRPRSLLYFVNVRKKQRLIISGRVYGIVTCGILIVLGSINAYSTFHSLVTGSSSLLTINSTAHNVKEKNTLTHLHQTWAG